MSPDEDVNPGERREERKGKRDARGRASTEGGKKSIEEVRIGERMCPFWVHEAVIDVWRAKGEKEAVNFCMATGKMICLRDYKNYDNCEYYIQFKKGKEDNVPASVHHVRFPMNPMEEDRY